MSLLWLPAHFVHIVTILLCASWDACLDFGKLYEKPWISGPLFGWLAYVFFGNLMGPQLFKSLQLKKVLGTLFFHFLWLITAWVMSACSPNWLQLSGVRAKAFQYRVLSRVVRDPHGPMETPCTIITNPVYVQTVLHGRVTTLTGVGWAA